MDTWCVWICGRRLVQHVGHYSWQGSCDAISCGAPPRLPHATPRMSDAWPQGLGSWPHGDVGFGMVGTPKWELVENWKSFAKLCKALKTIQTIFKNQPGVHIFGSRWTLVLRTSSGKIGHMGSRSTTTACRGRGMLRWRGGEKPARICLFVIV